MKLAALGVDSRVVVWVREFPVGHTQRVRVGGQLSKEVKVTSGVPQGDVLGPLMFLVYVNDIWRNIDSCIGLFTDDHVIYRKIIIKTTVTKHFLYICFLGLLASVTDGSWPCVISLICPCMIKNHW